MHKLSNIRFNADKRDYAHLQIKRMLAAPIIKRGGSGGYLPPLVPKRNKI